MLLHSNSFWVVQYGEIFSSRVLEMTPDFLCLFMSDIELLTQ